MEDFLIRDKNLTIENMRPGQYGEIDGRLCIKSTDGEIKWFDMPDKTSGMTNKQLVSYLRVLRSLHAQYVEFIIGELKNDGIEESKYINPLFFFESEILGKEIDELGGNDISPRLRNFVKREISSALNKKEGKNG